MSCRASGKIFIAGEDLDWTNRRCLMFALPLFTTVTVTPSSGIIIRQKGEQEIVSFVDEFHYTGLMNDYIKAALHLWNRDVCSVDNILIDITSMIPIAAGLGSSAAILNALFGELADYYKVDVDVCHLGYLTEHDIIGAVVGSVDFYISQSTGIMLYDNSGENVKIGFLDNVIHNVDLLLLYSGNTSNTAEINREKMERYIRQDRDFLSYLELTDALIEDGCRAVEKGRLDELGKTITAAHNTMSRYLRNSTEEIDRMVQLCNEYGAYGSKLTGCGKGGYVYSMIEKEKASLLCDELLDRKIKYMRLQL